MRKMTSDRTQRFLAIYSGVLTVVFAATVIAACATATKKARFDEVDVHRINIVEPDGTIRLVISDRAKFPGSYFQGKEISRPDRRTTGMLFLNDEGTEMGGLIFDGAKDKDGQIRSNGHLSFDQYDQDQIFAIEGGQEGSAKRTMLVISDRGEWPLHESYDEIARIKELPAAERQIAMRTFVETHPGNQTRIVLGRAQDKSVVLRMQDTDGRDRIVMKVDGDGTPLLRFLDENGKVLDELPSRKSPRVRER
jgi:hypothetical protein